MVALAVVGAVAVGGCAVVGRLLVGGLPDVDGVEDAEEPVAELEDVADSVEVAGGEPRVELGGGVAGVVDGGGAEPGTTSVTVTGLGVGGLTATMERVVWMTRTVSVTCAVSGGLDWVTVRVAGGSVSTVVRTTVTGGEPLPEPGPEPGSPLGAPPKLPLSPPSMGTTE